MRMTLKETVPYNPIIRQFSEELFFLENKRFRHSSKNKNENETNSTQNVYVFNRKIYRNKKEVTVNLKHMFYRNILMHDLASVLTLAIV